MIVCLQPKPRISLSRYVIGGHIPKNGKGFDTSSECGHRSLSQRRHFSHVLLRADEGKRLDRIQVFHSPLKKTRNKKIIKTANIWNWTSRKSRRERARVTGRCLQPGRRRHTSQFLIRMRDVCRHKRGWPSNPALHYLQGERYSSELRPIERRCVQVGVHVF